MEKKTLFMTGLITFMHGLYPSSFPTEKQLKAMELAGRRFTPPDFSTSFYRSLLLLAAEL
jgi:hypothetical protein